MGDVLKFGPRKKTPTAQSSLCREGHHKWKVEKNSQFDVKQGRLVSVYRCQRCGKRKTTAH